MVLPFDDFQRQRLCGALFYLSDAGTYFEGKPHFMFTNGTVGILGMHIQFLFIVLSRILVEGKTKRTAQVRNKTPRK